MVIAPRPTSLPAPASLASRPLHVAALAARDRAPQSARIQALPGGLDATPVFNSNHPEIVKGPGIALSSLCGVGPAHLDRAFTGPFEIFTHHVNGTGKRVHQGIVLVNQGDRPVTVKLGPSALRTGFYGLFFHLPRAADGLLKLAARDRDATSGPGPAVAEAIINGERQRPETQIVIAPGQTFVLDSRRLDPWMVASSKWELSSDGPVRAAVVFDQAPLDARRARQVLEANRLAARNPKDLAPTKPGESSSRFIFGRVAGIQEGARWQGTLSNRPDGQAVVLGARPLELAWPIVTKRGHLLGTGQDQTAPVSQRLPDAAYAAHGNYGISYELALPLRNDSDRTRRVELLLDSPKPTPGMPLAFSGPVELSWQDAAGKTHRQVTRLNLRPESSGRIGSLELPPGATLNARVRIVYPGDATPPQILRLRVP
ncbi:MAG: DUF3370 family protein [Candidatus Sericytochromatia bacterium]|nr:DUF3370 family protein [Candidatus Sericytochromatia bacterium]